MHTTTDHPSKVTVVMPVYNGRRKSEHYLPEAIDSVLAQTYPHFELIIVDDGSDEDYSDLMEKYRSEPRIRWVRKENGGQSSARNYGATLGTGQFLAFIDQDDRWYPLRLEKTVERMIHAQKTMGYCVLVYGEIDRIDEHGRIIYRYFLRTNRLGTHPKIRLEQVVGEDVHILPGTMLLEREKFLALGGFNIQLSGYEDDELVTRLFHEGALEFIDEPLIQWRIYAESYSYSERMDQSRQIYFNILKARYSDDPALKAWLGHIIASRFRSTWVRCLLRAVQTQNDGAKQRALAGLRDMIPYLTLRQRLETRIFLSLPPKIAFLALNILKRFRRRAA